MSVINVLITTASASSKVGALGNSSLGRGVQHLSQLRFGKLLLLARDLRGDAVAIDRERNEDRFAVIARDAFAAKGDVMNGQFNRAHARTSSKLQAPSTREIPSTKHQRRVPLP